ncbi:hypothetical protein PR048_015009 [Dryococelus australis]|uniref:DUF5641 domain-containing protein n=1 Tax=Dryococelus australis TaxID=614101 RepID=A0ABQ9HFS0_9NEOP|nr:hypothetical protein PR048_015009 [Dryococelus australis]
MKVPLVHAVRREDRALVKSLALSSDERGSVALIVPTPLGLKRGKQFHKYLFVVCDEWVCKGGGGRWVPGCLVDFLLELKSSPTLTHNSSGRQVFGIHPVSSAISLSNPPAKPIAVHLELVPALSSESFLLASHRFVARRGRPKVIYSDNGTNFRGAENMFTTLDWEQIVKYSITERIDWRFNPSSAAWWGGFWERLVGLANQLLRCTLGRAAVTSEELHTIICDCEAQINSRPITYLSDDNTDPVPVTTPMFLQDVQYIGVPDCDANEACSMTLRVRYRWRLREELRKRFRSEYLGNLSRIKRRTTRSPAVGEVVIIGSDNLKRLNWPLAVIEQPIEGRDGQSPVHSGDGALVEHGSIALIALPRFSASNEGKNWAGLFRGARPMCHRLYGIVCCTPMVLHRIVSTNVDIHPLGDVFDRCTGEIFNSLCPSGWEQLRATPRPTQPFTFANSARSPTTQTQGRSSELIICGTKRHLTYVSKGEVGGGGNGKSLTKPSYQRYLPGTIRTCENPELPNRGLNPYRLGGNTTTFIWVGATVAERLDCSIPTKANRLHSPDGSLRIFASRTRILGYSRGSPVSTRPLIPARLHARLTSLLIGSQGLGVKIPSLTHPLFCWAQERAECRFMCCRSIVCGTTIVDGKQHDWGNQCQEGERTLSPEGHETADECRTTSRRPSATPQCGAGARQYRRKCDVQGRLTLQIKISLR